MGTGLTMVLHRKATEGSFVVVMCLRAQSSWILFFYLCCKAWLYDEAMVEVANLHVSILKWETRTLRVLLLHTFYNSSSRHYSVLTVANNACFFYCSYPPHANTLYPTIVGVASLDVGLSYTTTLCSTFVREFR